MKTKTDVSAFLSDVVSEQVYRPTSSERSCFRRNVAVMTWELWSWSSDKCL